MTIKTGKNTKIFISTTVGGAKTAFASIKEWEDNQSFDAIEVTCFGDGQMTYIAGERDATGSFSGYVDLTSQQAFQASLDGTPRDFVIYPDYTDLTKYTSGAIIISCTRNFTRTGAMELSGTWWAAGPIANVI